MNYLLNSWFFLLILTVCFIIALVLAYNLQNFLLKANVPQFGIISIASFLATIFLWLSCCWFFYYQLNDGKVKELYIVNSSSGHRLTVLLTPRLKTFDLETGKFIGQLDFVKWRYPRDYKIFGPFGNKAWGYCKKSGLALLDIARPRFIANENKILTKNPQLGKTFRLIYSDNIYDPVTHGILVIAHDGRYFRINSDLTATHVDDFVNRYLPEHEYWTFDKAVDSAGKTLRRKGAPKSHSKKTVLLGPAFIRELNKKSAVKNNKVWVLHYSTLFGDYDLLISYLNANGQELARINLCKMFKNKYTKPVATLTRDNEVLVFVTKRDYTIAALRTDPVTGNVRSMIEYIK